MYKLQQPSLSSHWTEQVHVIREYNLYKIGVAYFTAKPRRKLDDYI